MDGYSQNISYKLNKWVFSPFLNDSTEGEKRRFLGRLFQRRGAHTANAL